MIRNPKIDVGVLNGSKSSVEGLPRRNDVFQQCVGTASAFAETMPLLAPGFFSLHDCVLGYATQVDSCPTSLSALGRASSFDHL
jgi:hypothetical protein